VGKEHDVSWGTGTEQASVPPLLDALFNVIRRPAIKRDSCNNLL